MKLISLLSRLGAALLLCQAALLLCQSAATGAEKRIALVMGVWDYESKSLPDLPGIEEDVKRFSERLQQLGFEVTVSRNPSIKEAKAAVDEFGEKLKNPEAVGLFYFSGHGGEFDGANFLIPKTAVISSRSDLDSEALSSKRLLSKMETAGSKVNLVFLDCCRNEFTKAAAGGSPGMAAMSAKGTFIGFATASAKEANATREGSVYTNALLKFMGDRGLSITDMHTKVTGEVMKITGEGGVEQTPFQYSGLSDLFYFVPGDGVSLPPVVDRKPVPPQENDHAPSPAPKDDAGIMAFFARWWDHQQSDNPAIWASDFTSPCDYSTPDRVKAASRAHITEDRRKLVEGRYTRRIYNLLEEPVSQVDAEAGTATMTVHYAYRYSGQKVTRGRAHVNMELVRLDGRWLISTYKETTERGTVVDAGGGDKEQPKEERDAPAEGARAALGDFVQSWWNHQSSDSAATWAADFRSPCNYCHGEGHSTRAFIQQDRQKLLKRYTSRVLRLITQPEVNYAGGTTATMSITYAYSYSGTKNASGRTTISLSLSWNGSNWGITRYDEKTQRD